MERFKSAVSSTKDFVVRHKTALAVTSTAAVLIYFNRVAIRDYKNFLETNELNDQYISYLESA